MLSSYDLYDLHTIFVGIRHMPLNDLNKDILLQVIDVLKLNREVNEPNQFRKALQQINELDTEEFYSFAFIDNVYTYHPLPFLKNNYIYNILIESCECLLDLVNKKDEHKIYALADLLENTPLILVENNYKIPNTWWKFLKQYRKKWDKTFLANQKKQR